MIISLFLTGLSSTSFKSLFVTPDVSTRFISPTRPFLAVIDTVDVCNDRRNIKGFISVLTSAGRSRALPLHWLLTSRGEEHIHQEFSDDIALTTTAVVALEYFVARVAINNFLT